MIIDVKISRASLSDLAKLEAAGLTIRKGDIEPSQSIMDDGPVLFDTTVLCLDGVPSQKFLEKIIEFIREDSQKQY